jgi:hypothetical protein
METYRDQWRLVVDLGYIRRYSKYFLPETLFKQELTNLIKLSEYLLGSAK